jgi:hypothetical protein
MKRQADLNYNVSMSNAPSRNRHHGLFIAAMIVVIFFSAIFVLMLAIILPELISGYGKDPGSWGPRGEVGLFFSWFILGPAGIVSALLSLISLCLTDRKKWSAIFIAIPFLAFGLSLFLELFFQYGGISASF